MVRQLVGACVELGIGQLLIIEDARPRRRACGCLFFKEFVNAFVLWVIGSGVVPFDE